MNRFVTSVALGATVLASAVFAMPVSAQQMGPPGPVPVYDQWQPSWDQDQFDRRHVMLGRVVHFSPYRLTIERHGNQQTLDLKGGTIIRPTGTTPQAGERIAAIGYWSNGTFIVNRLVVRP
jgi:hypothetical protein